MTALLLDARHALRLMAKRPGFTAVCVLMLALGTGTNAAMFSVIDGVLLRSPFSRPSEIAIVTGVTSNGRTTNAIPREAFDRLGAVSHVLAAVASYTGSSPVVTRVDVPRRTQVECVSATMADVLGARPIMGRWFTTLEDRPGGPPVVLVSDYFWRTALNRDPAVLGRAIALDDVPATIIGVMPRGFNGPLSRRDRDMWAPLGQATSPGGLYGCRVPTATANAFVRLQPGVSLDDAVAAINAAVLPAAGIGDFQTRFGLTPITEQTLGDLRQPLIALTGAVLAVLLIACANVLNLGLERLMSRRREIAVRLALGATRGRIVRQTVTEQLLQAAIGGAVGVLFAWLTLDALVALLPASVPNVATVELNVRVLVASIASVLAGGLLVGLVPGWQASAADLREGLADSDRAGTRRSHRTRSVLVVAEIALGAALLVGALLMIRTFLTLRPSAPGFDPTNKLIALVRLPPAMTLAERQRFAGDLTVQLLETPGIRAVAGTTYIPMSRSVSSIEMSVGDVAGEVWTGTVTPNYFDVMAIPVMRGRGFNESDGPANPGASVVVNEAFVRRWLPGREPIGAGLTIGGSSMPRVEGRIVGVIADTRSMGMDTRARPELYLPFAQTMLGSPSFVVAARPETMAQLPTVLRDVVTRLKPGQLVDRIESYEDMLSVEVATPRFGAWLLGLFAALAVALAVVGLGATLSWSVTERRREIGVRMALGADRRRVHTMVLWQALRLAGPGIAIGLVLAAWATRFLQGWVYGITTTDVATYASCAVAMLAASSLAAYLPARRATLVDPLVALRGD